MQHSVYYVGYDLHAVVFFRSYIKAYTSGRRTAGCLREHTVWKRNLIKYFILIGSTRRIGLLQPY